MDDFYLQLQRIEYQAARVAENPNFDKILDHRRNVMKESGVHLLTAIVRFLNFALVSFSEGFTGNPCNASIKVDSD